MYLGDDSSIPLINRGAAEVNNPTAAVPYKPSGGFADFLNTILPSAGAVTRALPLINQPGGTYNYPEMYAASTSSTYTPPQRAKADLNKLLLVVGAAAGIGLLLPTRSRRRLSW